MSIRSRKHHKATQLAALIAAAIPVLTVAEEQKGELSLPAISVSDTAQAPSYKASRSANDKMTEDLLDTPKTVHAGLGC